MNKGTFSFLPLISSITCQHRFKPIDTPFELKTGKNSRKLPHRKRHKLQCIVIAVSSLLPLEDWDFSIIDWYLHALLTGLLFIR